jgi:hypothetical protein
VATAFGDFPASAAGITISNNATGRAIFTAEISLDLMEFSPVSEKD